MVFSLNLRVSIYPHSVPRVPCDKQDDTTPHYVLKLWAQLPGIWGNAAATCVAQRDQPQFCHKSACDQSRQLVKALDLFTAL